MLDLIDEESEVEDDGFDSESEDSGDAEDKINEENSEGNPISPVTYEHGSNARAVLQYRDDGTLIVPDIRSFEPPTAISTSQYENIFPLQHRPHRQFLRFPRFVHRSDHNTMLIYADGACLNNGKADAAAGWGFVFREPEPGKPKLGRVSGRLEEHGPSGEAHPQASNRAELRAVIGALKFRAWFNEGWKKLVVATDSEYVAKGATEWVQTWGRNNWVRSSGAAVKNRDLWEELLGEVIGYQAHGMEICFWRIPRALNVVADQTARAGAREERCRDFTARVGVAV